MPQRNAEPGANAVRRQSCLGVALGQRWDGGNLDAAKTLIRTPGPSGAAMQRAFASDGQGGLGPALRCSESIARPGVARRLGAAIGAMEDDVGAIDPDMPAQFLQPVADRVGGPVDGRADQLPRYARDQVLEIRACPERAGVGAEPEVEMAEPDQQQDRCEVEE